MPELTRTLAKQVVDEALHRIADYDGDIETYTFRRFGPFHKQVFLASIKAGIVAIVRNPNSHYDIDLNSDSIAGWATVKDCIDAVYEDSYTRQRQTRRLDQNDLEAA